MQASGGKHRARRAGVRVRASRYAASRRIGVPSLSRAGRNRRRHDHSERLGWIKPSRVGRWRRVLVDVRWVREAASTTAGPAYRLEIASESSGVGIIMPSLQGLCGEVVLKPKNVAGYFEQKGEFNG